MVAICQGAYSLLYAARKHHVSSRWATPYRVRLFCPSRSTGSRRLEASEEGGATWNAPDSKTTIEGEDNVVTTTTPPGKTPFEHQKLEKDRSGGSRTARTLLLGEVALHNAAFVFSKDGCVRVFIP